MDWRSENAQNFQFYVFVTEIEQRNEKFGALRGANNTMADKIYLNIAPENSPNITFS